MTTSVVPTWRRLSMPRIGIGAVPSWRVVLILIGALGLAAGLAALDARPVGVVHDDAMYVILARSLAAGKGYRFLNIPGSPAATHFPPGYPALLAAVSLVAPAFPANVVVFKALNALFLGAAAVLIVLLARPVVGTRWAAIVGLTSAVSVPLLTLGTMVLSETLFLALALATLLRLEALVAAPSVRVRQGVTLGAAIALCTLVRTHGIVLLPAAVIALLLRRRPRVAAGVAGATVLCLAPWQLWSAQHAAAVPEPLLGNYGSYAGWWLRGVHALGPGMISETVAKTSSETAGMLAALFSPIRGAAAHAVTIALLVTLCTSGVVAVWRRAPATALFAAGYAAIVAIWPFAPARFVWGVWPLLLLLVVAGARVALVPERPSPLRIAAGCALAWLAVGYGAYELRAVRGAWWSSIARANTRRIVPLVRWTLANTAPTDVIATDDEGAVFLYTGRQAVPVFSFTATHYLRDRTPLEDAAAGLAPILRAYPVTTVLAGTPRTLDVARVLCLPPLPRLVVREEFAGGVALTVLPQ